MPFTVFYDGGCPLCRREIAIYQNLTPLKPIVWHNLVDNTIEANNHQPKGNNLPKSVNCQQLMARFHIQDESGQLKSGAKAFIAMWDRLPYWRWLARLCRLPGITSLTEWCYVRFLTVRPKIQNWFINKNGA